jgi:hypothetical protein
MWLLRSGPPTVTETRGELRRIRATGRDCASLTSTPYGAVTKAERKARAAGVSRR